MKLLTPVHLHLKRKLKNEQYRIPFLQAQIRDGFAAFVYERRLEKLLTQQQLGDLCGMAKTRISVIERGDAALTVRTMVRIADALGAKVKVEIE